MQALETLRSVVVFAHLIGFAVLFGAWTVEAVARRVAVTRVMYYGFALAAGAGIVLGAPFGLTDELNYAKLGVKLVILLIIGVLLGVAAARQRQRGSVPPADFWLIGILTLTNAGIAVLWR